MGFEHTVSQGIRFVLNNGIFPETRANFKAPRLILHSLLMTSFPFLMRISILRRYTDFFPVYTILAFIVRGHKMQ